MHEESRTQPRLGSSITRRHITRHSCAPLVAKQRGEALVNGNIYAGKGTQEGSVPQRVLHLHQVHNEWDVGPSAQPMSSVQR